MTVDALLREASRLTPAERGELLDALLVLNASQGSDDDLTPDQQEDLDRRIEEYRAGKTKLIPGDEAIAMLRKRP